MTDRTVRAFRSSLEIRGLDDGGRTVVGLAVPFDTPAQVDDWMGSYVETFRPGSFTRTIAERGPGKVKAMFGHNYDSPPIGRAVELREGPEGLWCALRLSHTPRADEVLTLVRDQALDSFSVGFMVPTGGDRWTRDRSHREVAEAKLLEISVCMFPVYEDALVSGVRHTTPPSAGPGIGYWAARLRAFESEF